MKAGCAMGGQSAIGGHAAHANATAATAPQNTPPQTALVPSVQVVFDNYLKIQAGLAQDSIQGMKARASVIAEAIQTDTAKALPVEVGQQAEALAKISDIKAARESFKQLSDSLIKYLAANKAYAGLFVKVFCPMANARWLQRDTVVNNPYFGQSMARCGKIES